MKLNPKTKERLLSIWKDPVWSKVISTGILALIAVIWAKFSHHSWSDIYHFILVGLSFPVPIYLVLSAIGLFYLVRRSIRLFGKKKDPFWDQRIANYIFKDLYNFMLLETLSVPTQAMMMSGMHAPTDNLLLLFQVYYMTLNKGVGIADNIQDGGYLYAVLAPRLVGFGLVDAYQKPDDDLPEHSDIAYRTSELGHKFHAALDKVWLEQKMKDVKKSDRS